MRTNQVEVTSVEQLNDHALLALIERGLAALDTRSLDEVDDTTLAERVEQLHRVETITAAQKLRCIAELNIRQTWQAEGARSTADLLARRLHLTRGEARAQTDTAIALEGLRKPQQQSAQARSDSAKPKSRSKRPRICAPMFVRNSTSWSPPTGPGWTAASYASMLTPGPPRTTRTRLSSGRAAHGPTGGYRLTPTVPTARPEDSSN
jgi:hypothetical protein